MLNKWVSMLKKKRCMFDPWKTGRGGGWITIVSCIVLSVGWNVRNFINNSVCLSFFEENSYVKYYPACLLLEAHLLSLHQRVLECKKCGKSSRFSLECRGHSWEFAPCRPRLPLRFGAGAVHLLQQAGDFPFLLLWFLKLHLCLGSRFSVLGDLICLSLLFLLAVRTVCGLIEPLPAHLQPWATLCTLSHL